MDGVRGNLGWRNSWWMVLWAAGAILHCSFHMAQAQIHIEVDTPIPMEMQEVLMSPPIPPDDTIFCNWYRDIKLIMTVYPDGGEPKHGPGYTGRETVYPNCSLHIKELIKNDSATYWLVEGGPKISDSGNVTLKVIEFLEKPIVVIFPACVLVEGKGVQLSCITNVTHEVSWFKDDVPLGDGYHLSDFNRTLIIASVSRTDSGEYKCRVSNGITSVDSEPEPFSVIYGPEGTAIHPNEACNEEHQNIILSCHADSFPEPLYTWFRDDVQVDDGPKLFIQDFNQNQTGVYVCEAMNQILHKSERSDGQQIRLKTSCVSGVTLTGSSPSIEGNDTTLHCTAEGDNVEYSWFKGNQPVKLDERVTLTDDGKTLNFKPSLRGDAADYKCKASNSYSSGESDPYPLTIIYGPDPPFINETIDINLAKVSLTCVAVAHPPSENVWFYNGEEVEGNPKVLVLDIVPENSGNYTCEATNPSSGFKHETTLEIDMIGKLRSLRRR